MQRSGDLPVASHAGVSCPPQMHAEEAVYGSHGVLDREGDTITCHLCGRAFRSLARHIRRAHGLSAAAYRERFGLTARTGLVGSGP